MNEKKRINSLGRVVRRFADGEPVLVKTAKGAEGSTVRMDARNAWLQNAQKEEVRFYRHLHDWLRANAVRIYRTSYHLFAALVCVVLMVTLLITVSYLPPFGNPENPANNEVPERYIEQGLTETGAVNIVSGMILDYRAFDTLGESHVLFLAACCVIILLRKDVKRDGSCAVCELEKEEAPAGGGSDAVLRCAARVLVPVIFLFGIYVILNGHLSAGGGFSGGAGLGAGLILYRCAFGAERTREFFRPRTFQWVSFGALLCYAALKAYAFYTGANGLESGIPLGTPGAILSSGLILPLNICVGCVVACTMYAFYALFSEGGI